MKHVFILKPFIWPVDKVGWIGIKVFLKQSQRVALFRFLTFGLTHKLDDLNQLIQDKSATYFS